MGLRRHRPERERQRARHRRLRPAARSSSATPGSSRARTRTTPTRRSSARTGAPAGGETGPGHYGAVRRRARVPDGGADPTPMPSECDDGPFGRGTGGQLRYRVQLGGHGTETLWIAVAGSENSPGEARSELARLTHRPERLAAEKIAARRALARHSRVRLPGDPALQESLEWGKQNLADLTQTADGRRPPLVGRGQGVDARGLPPAHDVDRRRLPRLPVAVRRGRRVHRARGRDARAVRGDRGPHARAARHLRPAQRPLRRRRARGRRRRLDLARQGQPRASTRRRARSSTTSTRTRSSSSRPRWR